MGTKAAVIVVAAAVATLENLGVETAYAFSFLGHHRHKQHQQQYEYRFVRLHSATSSSAEAAAAEEHPHTKIWTTTLNDDKNTSYVHPYIELAVRPPSDGGTGIIVTNNIPMNTVALSLALDNVGMIDAASILDSYDDETDDVDGVLVMLKNMWNKEFAKSSTDDNNNDNNSDEGKRLAVLAGIIAHLQLTRYKDSMLMDTEISPSSSSSSSYAIEQSRRLGLFLDAMPLLPQHATTTNNKVQSHPFPTHFLYWTDDEIQILLQGTMCQTKAREVRAGIGLVIREWSSSFLAEHHHGSTTISQTDILNAIFSAFTAVLSRSFGDAAGRDVDGKGRMLVPLVDFLNHNSEDPNVKWTWHVGEGDDELISEGKGDVVVTTTRSVSKGEELYKCYGWRPAWDIASSYGFVPMLKRERWECTVIPLFPAVLDLAPDTLPTPNDIANDKVDLLLESNYGPLVKAIIAAVDAANEIKAKQLQQQQQQGNSDDSKAIDDDDSDSDRPEQLNRLEVVSLFRRPTAEYPFPLRQPCVVVGTKIQNSPDDTNDHYHRHAIESVLPAFRASASALAQLRSNHESDDDHATISASSMTIAAASLDKSLDWDIPAIELLNEGIKDRLQTLESDGKTANEWLATRNEAISMDAMHREFRADVAKDVRNAELMVLRTLQITVTEMANHK